MSNETSEREALVTVLFDACPNDWDENDIGLLADALVSAGATIAPAPVSVTTVEEVARVIDPDAWGLSDDEYFAEYDDGMHGVGHCLSSRGPRRRTSLATARKIVDLRLAPAPVSVTTVERFCWCGKQSALCEHPAPEPDAEAWRRKVVGEWPLDRNPQWAAETAKRVCDEGITAFAAKRSEPWLDGYSRAGRDIASALTKGGV